MNKQKQEMAISLIKTGLKPKDAYDRVKAWWEIELGVRSVKRDALKRLAVEVKEESDEAED